MELSDKAAKCIKQFRKTQAEWQKEVMKKVFSSEDCDVAHNKYKAAQLDLCLTVAIDNGFFAEDVK